jgi:hypothetical protein
MLKNTKYKIYISHIGSLILNILNGDVEKGKENESIEIVVVGLFSVKKCVLAHCQLSVVNCQLLSLSLSLLSEWYGKVRIIIIIIIIIMDR